MANRRPQCLFAHPVLGHIARPARLLVPLLALAGLVATPACKSDLPKRWSDMPAPDPSLAPTAGAATLAPVHIVGPEGAPRVATDLEDGLGRPVTVACSSCHQHKQPDRKTRTGEQLETFHQGLTMQHAQLTCVTCHDQTDYDRLRLADGTPVEFPQVITLCRQCHGPQARDYDQGSHGGMTGYWDRSRGTRIRNGCTTCHDPHAPAYQGMIPAPPPRDRLADPSDDPHHDSGAQHE